ncbi:MAG: OmpA family protein, partial [Pseudomonas putida]
LAKNNSAANRARNRRVNIELERVAVVEKAVEQVVPVAPTSAPASPAAVPASGVPGAKAP